MTSRRRFLGTIAGAGAAILAGPEVLEEFARLTHVRKSFPSASLGLQAAKGSLYIDAHKRIWVKVDHPSRPMEISAWWQGGAVPGDGWVHVTTGA